MFKHFWTFLVLALFLQSNVDHVECRSYSLLSWVYRGTAQLNNTVLTFNQLDTLNLVCKATGENIGYYMIYAITKGPSAPTNMTFDYSTGDLTIIDVGTLVFSAIDGTQPGYENFIIYTGPFNHDIYGDMKYEFLYVNVGTLRTTDSGTYHCSGFYADDEQYLTSGGLTVMVNTKPGQARSSRTRVNSYMAYSAAILGASKLLV